MLSKCLIQFSVDGWSCVPSLLFTWGQTMVEVEDNGDLLQKDQSMYCYSQCSQPCSRSPLTHASAGDSWTLPVESESVSALGSLLLSPASWCIQGSVCALQESYFPVLCKFWRLSVGLMATSSKRAYAIPKRWICNSWIRS